MGRGALAAVTLTMALILQARAAGSALAAGPHQLTTRQMEALGPRRVDSIVKQDLLSVLQPVRRLSQGRRPFLHNVDQTTRPFATEYRGLCRRDVVRLRYAPSQDTVPYPDQKLRPYSVEAKAQFALRTALPLVASWRHPSPAEPARDTDCGRQSDDADVAWFYAPDEREAALAINLLDAARSRVKAGTLKAQNFMNGDGIEPKDLDRIQPCKAEPDMICYRYVIRDAGLLTLVAQDENAGEKVSPDDVVSVREEVLIDDDPDGWP